jgi:hypothetical protein
MNAQVNLESIELAKLNAEVIVLAHSIIALTAVAEDVIATIDQGAFQVIYLGRGSEIFGLGLSEAFKPIDRINYAKGLVSDFTKIKTDIEQNYMSEVC